MSLLWNYFLDCASQSVQQVPGALAWKKMLLLAKLTPYLRKPATPEVTDHLMLCVTILISLLIRLKLPFCDMVMLQLAHHLATAALYGWIITRGLQKKVSPREILVNLVCNWIS